MTALPDFTIPTFHVELDSADKLAESVARIKQGSLQYDAGDICVFSNWIGVCCFQYMADQFEKQTGGPVTKDDLLDYRLYAMHCGKVARITSEMLKKVDIPVHSADIFDFSLYGENHVTAIGYFSPKNFSLENPNQYAAIMYDASGRQFFATNKKNILREEHPYYSFLRFAGRDLLKTETGQLVATEITQSGSVNIDEERLETYIGAFTSSLSETNALKSDNSQKGVIDKFMRDYSLSMRKNDPRKYYTALPGDRNFPKRFAEFSDLQNRLNP